MSARALECMAAGCRRFPKPFSLSGSFVLERAEGEARGRMRPNNRESMSVHP